MNGSAGQQASTFLSRKQGGIGGKETFYHVQISGVHSILDGVGASSSFAEGNNCHAEEQSA
jgi:hypothetical protein